MDAYGITHVTSMHESLITPMLSSHM